MSLADKMAAKAAERDEDKAARGRLGEEIDRIVDEAAPKISRYEALQFVQARVGALLLQEEDSYSTCPCCDE